ncbi:DNA replication protein [Vanrija albida]|uniref:DNA replication complex GINS protein PSF3 n=1 Tax=Vanrija albida TaxID=181172 RepID=A0ABR3Q9W1_9TREE
MDNDYYSLTAVLADNHKLACTFSQDVPGMGHIDGSSEADLRAGAKAELPMWLASSLCLNELTEFVVPAPFGPRVKAALTASAPSVRLSSLVGQGGWWYRFGGAVAEIWDRGDDLLGTLLRAFIKRLPALQDLAAHHASADVSVPESGPGTGEAFREGMDADERELFGIGQTSGSMVKGWYDTVWGRRR